MKDESGRLIDVFLKSWHFTLINGVCEKVKPFLHYTDTSEIKISSQIVYCCVFDNFKASCYGKTCHYFITKAEDYLGISDLS